MPDRTLRRARLGQSLACIALLAATAASCGGDSSSTVDVTLKEWAVGTDVASVPAGSVTFEATNEGPADPHELVIIKTDLALTALPTGDNGAVDEAGAGIEIIGEIEEFDVGGNESGTFELSAGAYVLICNVFEIHEGQPEAHYQLGMRTPFTVT